MEKHFYHRKPFRSSLGLIHFQNHLGNFFALNSILLLFFFTTPVSLRSTSLLSTIMLMASRTPAEITKSSGRGGWVFSSGYNAATGFSCASMLLFRVVVDGNVWSGEDRAAAQHTEKCRVFISKGVASATDLLQLEPNGSAKVRVEVEKSKDDEGKDGVKMNVATVSMG